jgi:hypothetical protein
MDIRKEARAFESLTKLVAFAEECRNLFDEAGLDYPATLKRLLGEGDATGADSQARHKGLRIAPPPHVSRPVGVADGWIYVPLPALIPQTLAMGVLRSADAPLSPKQVTSRIRELGTEVNEGSVANIGTRLEKEGVIRRTKDGWSLVNAAKAPILNGKYAWGEQAVFTSHEMAARRREAIIYVLSFFRDGLQTAQILTQLENCAWLKTPLSKDLLKADMEELQRSEKVRRGASRKWIVADGVRV